MKLLRAITMKQVPMRVPLFLGCLALSTACSPPSPATGSSSSALGSVAWVVPPVLQQTHTVGTVASFSVLYVAQGGTCVDTLTPCVSTQHTLHYRVAGTTAWSTSALPAYPQGNGYLTSNVHMKDNSIDCQFPDYTPGFCGQSTTFWDVGDYGPHLSLEAGFPPWKIIKATGLQPDTSYEWFVTIDGDNANIDPTTSGMAQFRTPPVHSSGAPPFKFVFNADPQGNTPIAGQDATGSDHLDNQRRDNVLSAIATYSQPAFMISGGDLGLNGGATKLGTHWLTDASSGIPSIPTTVLSSIPFFPAFGNHDWMSAGSLDYPDCCAASAMNTPMPRHWNYTPTAAMVYGYTTGSLGTLGSQWVGPGARPTVPYYSFDWGNSHFLILSTGPDNSDSVWLGHPYTDTANVGIDSTQFAFADADLKAARSDPNTQHIFVALHDPVFHSNGDSTYPVNYPLHQDNTSPPPACGPSESCPNSPGQLIKLFRNYHVDMVLGGHVHTYSRIQDQGVWYVTAGIAGGALDKVEHYPGTPANNLAANGCNTTAVPTGQPPASTPCISFDDDGGPLFSTGFAKQTWGYVEVTVDGDSVSYTAKEVINGRSDGSDSNPPPAPVAFDSFTWGVAPPTGVAVALHDRTTGVGGLDITYHVNSVNPGTTQLFVSTTGDGGSFTHQTAYDHPYTASSGSATYTINDPEVTPGQTIYLQLQNVHGLSTSAMTPTVSLIVPACTMPALTATNTASGNVLTWPNTYSCAGVTLTSYQVYRQDDSGWTGIGSVAPGATSFVDTSWNCSADVVTYQVVAWGSATGNGTTYKTYSIPAHASGISLPWNPVCTPTSLLVTQTAQGQVQLVWNNAGHVWDSIIIERGTGPFCNGTVALNTIAGNLIGYTDNTPSADTLYCYTVTGVQGGAYYFSNTYKYHTWKNLSPSALQAQAIASNRVGLSWSYPYNSAATSTTIYRSTQPGDPASWEPVVTLNNYNQRGYITGTWIDDATTANDGFNAWQYQTNNDITYSYKAVGHYSTPTTDPDQSAAPDTTSYQILLTDNISSDSPIATVSPRSHYGCASGVPDTIFSPGVEACPGSVTYPGAASLCAPGYALCTAQQWDAVFHADGMIPPVNNYWLADNLGWAGSGPDNCSVSGAPGNCGSNDPMRVCGATLDAQHNACNWTGCGYQTSSVNGSGSEYFGGCVGNTTAGALCCATASSACSSLASSVQQFAPGVVGCAGSVTWDHRADLCGAGCTACSASQFVAFFAGAAPRYDYWTNDNLGYAGSSSSCGAYTTGGTSCGTNDPMRVCVPGTTTDPLGNVCNWHDCGFNGTPPLSSGDDYFGGCVGNPTAGTLCCCDQ